MSKETTEFQVKSDQNHVKSENDLKRGDWILQSVMLAANLTKVTFQNIRKAERRLHV